MTDDLSHFSPEAIDSLPFGYIALSPDGTIRRYNRYEADLARKDPAEVLGKNFFQEVAPCTQVQEFQGRFQDFVSGDAGEEGGSTLSFEFEFTFRHGTQRVRIGFVRSPLEREVIVTVNRLRDLSLPAQPKLEHRAVEGRWVDAAGQAVATVGPDFWIALDQLHGPAGEGQRALSHQLGKAWGSSYVQRIELFIQEKHQKTLREVEFHVALEALSGAIGLLGLGRFEVELGYRDRGLIVITHHFSPLAGADVGRDGPRCNVLAGMHAGFMEHLSGRGVDARELTCRGQGGEVCRFAVGTSDRLARLLQAEPGSTDADLLAALRASPSAVAEAVDG